MRRKIEVFRENDIGKSYSVICHFDSGSSVDLINVNLDILRDVQLKKYTGKMTLSGAFGQNSNIFGSVILGIVIDNVLKYIRFLVVSTNNFSMLIGQPSLSALRLKLADNLVYTKEGRVLGKNVRTDLNKIAEKDSNQVFHINSELDKEVYIQTNSQLYPVESKIMQISSLEQPKLIMLKEIELNPGFVVLPTVKNETNKFESIEEQIEKMFEINKFQIDASVNQVTRDKLKQLLKKYKNVFPGDKSDLGLLPNGFEYIQEFTVDTPPPVKIYSVDNAKKKIIREEILKLVKLGVLEESPEDVITSNLLVVPKKDGSKRVVIDLRNVNLVTKPSNLQLPNMLEIIHELMGREFYFSTDVTKAFWNSTVPIEQRKWYTCICPLTRQVYQFTRCPMGHRNSAVVFQKLIDRVLRKLQDRHLQVYIDDIICSENSTSAMLGVIEKLLKTLSEHNLRISLEKSIFFAKQLKCFGFIIDKTGVKPDKDRVKKLLEIPIPKNKKEMLSFLASLNFYREHIPKFSGLAANLYSLTGTKAKFELNNQLKADFEALKQGLAESILLNTIDETKNFVLETDASITGIGSILKQIHDNGEEKIIAVDSSSLKGAERLWAIASLELKACYNGLLKYEKIIGNKFVTLRVDNKSLFYLLKSKLAEVEISKKTPACRMLLYISTFFYTVEHKKGNDHTFRLCDLLSRMYENNGKFKLAENSKKPLISCVQIKQGEPVEFPILNVEKVISPNIPPTAIYEEIKLAQIESKNCKKIIMSVPLKFEIVDGVIFKKTKNGSFIYCPPFYSKSVLSKLHRHESAKNLLRKVNDYKIWIPDKYKLISAFVANCDICDPSRSKHLEKYESESISRPTLPFQTVAIDISGYGTENNFIVYVCLLTKYIHAKVLRNMTSTSVKNVLMEIFTIFGLPSIVLSDNATNFTSAEMKDFFETFGILHRRSSVMNSRGNGICEAAIKRIQNRTRIHQPKIEELPTYLNVICFELNTQKMEGSKLFSFQKVYHRDATWII